MLPKNKNPRIVPAMGGFCIRSGYGNYNKNCVLDKARGRWAEILESLGIPPGHLKNKHGPCPVCGGKDRFRFDDKNRGTFICSKCGSGDGVTLLRLFHQWNFQYTLSMISKIIGVYPSQSGYFIPKPYKQIDHEKKSLPFNLERNRQRLNLTWQSTKPISKNDPVDTYLKARGIILSSFPSHLRYHPSLPYFDASNEFLEDFPAMLALIQNHHNKNVCLHRTYLNHSGGKAAVDEPKKLMTPIKSGALRGSAIKLFEIVGNTLALAEGIETALSFYVATNIPVWATINAHGLENVIIPRTVENIFVLIDNDLSGTGQRAGIKLARRLENEGKKVKRIMPPTPGTDFNDLLLEGATNERENN